MNAYEAVGVLRKAVNKDGSETVVPTEALVALLQGVKPEDFSDKVKYEYYFRGDNTTAEIIAPDGTAETEDFYWKVSKSYAKQHIKNPKRYRRTRPGPWEEV